MKHNTFTDNWFFIICFTLISIFGQITFSQSIDSLRFTGVYSNIGIVNFLHSVEKQYPVKFYFMHEWFEDERISINAKDVPFNFVLDKVVDNRPYIYNLICGDIIVFMPKDKVALITGKMIDISREGGELSMTVVGNPNEAGMYNEVKINGSIRDGKTGETLIGASIQIENTTIGAISNLSGEYSLILKPGIYTLIASNIGYEKTEYKIKIISNGSLDIKLYKESISIKEIAIYAQRADKNVSSNQMSIVELDSRMIRQLPVIMGEKDLLKGLTVMPGVKSVGEFGSGINVRGGGEDQNLYLIEGAPIFNTSHVLGLLSVINPDAVSSLTLYKGHIPAGFGERVSSVIDVQLRDNNTNQLDFRGGIGLYNSRLMLEVPVIKDKLFFMLGTRKSYSDYLLTRMPDYYLQNSSASFYDVNGLIKLNLENNWFTIFGYTSYDRFGYASEMEYQYGNQLLSFNWGHFFNHNLNSSLIVSNSRYNIIKDELEPVYEESRTQSGICYSSAKLNFTFSGVTKHTIDVGIQGISYAIQPGKQQPLNDTSIINTVLLPQEQAIEFAPYINDLYQLTRHISINAGIRYSGYMYLGPHTLQQYQQNGPVSSITVLDTVQYKKREIIDFYQGFEPRLSVKYQLNDKNSVKMSYNRNKQYISLVSYTSISTPDDIWKLSDPFLKPVISNQWACGFYRNFLNNGIESSIELYYKKLSNIHDYKNGAELEMNHNIETELINGSGKNYGIEFLIKKNIGKLDGWISYTYSRTFIRTHGSFQDEIINRNELYPSPYDKPHDLSVFVNYNITRRIRVSANFMYTSGRSVTFPEYKANIDNYEVIYYSDRNKYRLPSYHRLDLSISVDESLWKKKKWKGSWTFSVLNVYARNNAYSVFYRNEDPNVRNDFQRFTLYKLYLIGEPLPTLTYNFVF